MILKVDNLKVHYGKSEVLRGIFINVNEREVVALIGANGAGKTTTLRTISGLKEASEGQITFSGERIEKKPAHLRTKMGIGHIPEGRRCFSELTVEKNLQLGGYTRPNRSEMKKDLIEMYKIFPVLGARSKQLAGTLSGGEQQMLATARGLMSKPKLLLMDEPSMGLAPLIVQEIAKIIRSISKMDTSILLVEQNAVLALSLASRAYVIDTGKIVLEGEAEKLALDEALKKAYLGF